MGKSKPNRWVREFAFSVGNGIDVYKRYIEVETANGKVRLQPAFCEVTGKSIGWISDPEFRPKDIPPDCQPVVLSYKVIDRKGRQLIDLRSISTF